MTKYDMSRQLFTLLFIANVHMILHLPHNYRWLVFIQWLYYFYTSWVQ